MPEWIGQTIGKVRIEKFLARGGMAEVYLGTHITLARPVAVKVLHSFIEEEPTLLERFQREARVVAGMRHPNIVQIFDFDQIDGHPYIVMEYLKGPTLATYLRPLHQHKQRIPHPQVARLLNGLAAAVDYAHERGVIHRDIKPHNILLHNKTDEIPLDQPLPEDVEAVLTDFGLVRLLDTGTHTTTGVISGTPAYMSPEQARGAQLDHRTDIYSLGIVLYELLAGHVPFTAVDAAVVNMQIHEMQIHAMPPPIPELSARVQAVLDHALQKNPKDRYQRSLELARDFSRSIGLITLKTLSGHKPSVNKALTALEAKPKDKRAQTALERQLRSEMMSLLRTLGDIGSYTAAIVAYLLAITGRAPTPYPNTVSFVTTLVTVIAVWLWRLPRITANSAARTSLSKTKTGKSSASEKREKSLLPRNLEVTALSFLSVAVLALGVFKFPTMREEVSGLNCLNGPGDFRVMITNMTFSPEQNFENHLGNTLVHQAQGLFQVCRYLREVDFIDDVYSVRAQYDMDLVIWGNYSSDYYQIEITATPEFAYAQSEGLPVKDTDDQVAFLTAETIAVIYFVKNELATAQTLLQQALDLAESQNWADQNPTLLADGYFLMAQILSANLPTGPSDLDPAINAYTRAIRVDPNFESAYWNQADLYLVQGRKEQALINYDNLINMDGKYAIDARVMKAQISLEGGDCLAAVKVTEETLQNPEVDQTHNAYRNLIYTLGKSRLACGDYSGAEQAFEEMPPLPAGFAPVFINDLEAMAGASDDPLLKEEISTIIKLLQQKIIP